MVSRKCGRRLGQRGGDFVRAEMNLRRSLTRFFGLLQLLQFVFERLHICSRSCGRLRGRHGLWFFQYEEYGYQGGSQSGHADNAVNLPFHARAS